MPLIIRRKYWEILSNIPLIFILALFVFSKEESFRTKTAMILLPILIILLVLKAIVPVARVKKKVIYVYKSPLRKPIKFSADTFDKAIIHKRESFPVNIELKKTGTDKKIVFNYLDLSSKSVEFYLLLKTHMTKCEFKELEYVEKEKNNFLSRVISKSFSDRTLILTASMLLVILVTIMYLKKLP